MNLKIYYSCGKETCEYQQITENDFNVCSKCFNTLDISTDQSKSYSNIHAFLSAQIKAILNIIS